MDYQVSLKNIILEEKTRLDIEERLFELKELASTYFVIIAKLEQREGLFYAQFSLKRDHHYLSSQTISGETLTKALDLAKEDLNTQLMAEFVKLAS